MIKTLASNRDLYPKKMLRLIYNNLRITEVSYKHFQKKTLIVAAVLSPASCVCTNCGFAMVDENVKSMVVKNEKKEIVVRFE